MTTSRRRSAVGMLSIGAMLTLWLLDALDSNEASPRTAEVVVGLAGDVAVG